MKNKKDLYKIWIETKTEKSYVKWLESSNIEKEQYENDYTYLLEKHGYET